MGVDKDLYINEEGVINLTCTVNQGVDSTASVLWYHDSDNIDYDSPRGGISMKTEKTAHKTISTLLLTKVSKSDTGNYTCAPDNAEPVSVMIFVVNGKLESRNHFLFIVYNSTSAVD